MLSKLISILIILLPINVYANDIYISQSGDNIDLDIVQDGQNNQIEGLSGSGNAIISVSYTHLTLPTRIFV